MDAIAGVIPGAIVGAAAAPVVAPVVNNPIDLALQWIDFENAATRDHLRYEGFSAFDDLQSMREKDISDLVESYGRRTKGKQCVWLVYRTART